MGASEHAVGKAFAQAEALYSQLVADELMLDEGKTLPERLEQMLTDLAKWSDLFTICPHCGDLPVCPWCDALFSDYKRFQAHVHECPGVAK